MALIEQPWLGAAKAEVGPAFNTAMPQPFLKSRAFASVRLALPEEIVPLVGGSVCVLMELHPPAGMYPLMSRHGIGPLNRCPPVHCLPWLPPGMGKPPT